MSEKSFGIKELNLMSASGTPTIESPNDIVFKSGGSNERVRITSGGNMGVGGLASPGALLSIPAGESNTPRLAIESAVDNNDFTITQYEDGNGTYTMLGQNVKLNSGGNNTILDSGHRTAGILLDARNHGAISFLTGGANAVGENLKIDSNGTVKIGSNTLITPSTDADNFVIDTGDVDSGLSILSATTGRIYFGDAASTDQGSIRYVHTDDSMRFETNSGERLRITSVGDVLLSGLTTKNDSRNAKGITLKSASGISFQNFGSNGSRNWRIRPDDLSSWGSLEFSVSPTDDNNTDWPDASGDVVLELKKDKNVVVSNGNLVIGTSGQGIDFSADPDASGRESELLDDYEHGTFTPTIKVEGQGSNAAIDNVSGTYIKVGKLVYAGFHVELNGVPSGRSTSAAIEFHGMPFTSLAEGSSGLEEHIGSVRCHPVDNSTSLGACSEFILRLFDNNTYGRIEVRKSDGNLANASLYMRDNMQITVAITYRTAS
jgi:hypothetical protein